MFSLFILVLYSSRVSDVIEHIFVEVSFAPTNPEDPYKASFFEYLFNAQYEHLLSLKIWSILECD